MRRLLCLLLLMAGCQSASQQVSEEPPPANYRQVAAEYMRKTLFDPWSARDAQIAAPVKSAYGPSLNSDGLYTPWVVCVRMNAKNRFGAYTGLTATALAIKGTEVVNSWDKSVETHFLCGRSPYEPFPELEAAAKR